MRTANESSYIAVFEAAHRIVLRSGCGAATMRAVALEGGLSPSTVRSHYRTQSHLLACAFAAVEDHFAREVSRTSHLLDRRADVRVEDAVQVLAVHLPTHGDGLDQLRLLHAYTAWARHDWDMAIPMAGFDQRFHHLCLTVCARLGVSRVHAGRQARLLRALVTGLAEELVTVCEPPEGERSLRLPDRLMESGARAVLVQHLRAVVDLTSSGQEGQRRPAPPVDRAG